MIERPRRKEHPMLKTLAAIVFVFGVSFGFLVAMAFACARGSAP